MTDYPKVSVCIITYNHAKFIEKTLSSIVMQKAEFPFEIIISNDCSTDTTNDVIRNFINNSSFENIIYYNHDQNIGANSNFIFVQKQASGEFIAFCEGDDYWLDEYKLQKQFDLLSANHDISLCFTSRIIIDNAGEFISDGNVDNRFWSTKEIALGIIPPLQTVFSRNYAHEFDKFMLNHNYSYGMDKIYAYFLSLQGNICSISDITAAYRIHDSGVWSKYNVYEKNKLHVDQSLLFFKVISENRSEETKLRDKFYSKIMLSYLFLFFSDPIIGAKQIIYFLREKKPHPKIIFTAVRKFLSYYLSLLKNKILR